MTRFPRLVAGWRTGSWPGLALLLLAVATLLGLIRLAQVRLGTPGITTPPGGRAQLVSQLGFWYGWAAVALPLVMAIIRRAAGPRPTLAGTIGFYAVAVPGALLAHAAIFVWITHAFRSWAGAPVGPDTIRAGVSNLLMNDLQILGAIIGATHAGIYYRRLREEEQRASRLAVQLAEARLDALRAQLHPHFLYNALNTIAMLARCEAHADVVRVVAGLSDLLRAVLDDDRPHLIPLREEVAVVEKYLAIESIRLGDRLTVSVQVAPDAEATLVPAFLLQPLVENAIQHGITPREEGGRLVVEARRRNGQLEVEVTDDGPGPPPPGQPPVGRGVGVANTRARLAQHYPGAHRLDIRRAPGGGTSVLVVLPAVATPPAPAEP